SAIAGSYGKRIQPGRKKVVASMRRLWPARRRAATSRAGRGGFEKREREKALGSTKRGARLRLVGMSARRRGLLAQPAAEVAPNQRLGAQDIVAADLEDLPAQLRVERRPAQRPAAKTPPCGPCPLGRVHHALHRLLAFRHLRVEQRVTRRAALVLHAKPLADPACAA